MRCTAPLIDEYMGRVDGPTHLDLRAVTFMDSSGLHVLERIQQRCQANDWPLVIEAVSPPVEWLLRLGGCDETLHRATTRAGHHPSEGGLDGERLMRDSTRQPVVADVCQDERVPAQRMLFSCRPLAGHYEPLLPLAVEAREAGVAVAFATGEPYVDRASEAGFESFRAGPGEAFRAEWAPRFPGFDRLVGDEQRRFFFTEIFANLELVPRAEDLHSIINAWAPDLVVHEVAELAAPLVCTGQGIPYVDVSYGSLVPLALLRAAGEAAAPHWRARGLDPDHLAGLGRHLYIDTCPPSLQNPEIASLPAVQALRPAAADPPTGAPPAWLERLGPRPAVYLTMGTVWNRDLSVFAQVIEALRDEAITLIVTVGRQTDPAALGPQPDNVVVHQYVPQGFVLARCDAVIAHGGAGTMLGALAHGLPLLVIPKGQTSTATPTGWWRPALVAGSCAPSCQWQPSGSPYVPCSTTGATAVRPSGSGPRSRRCQRLETRSRGSRRFSPPDPQCRDRLTAIRREGAMRAIVRPRGPAIRRPRWPRAANWAL